MSDQFTARPLVFLNEVAITKGATSTGSWFKVSRLQAMNIWWYMTASGSPSISLYFDYSIFPAGERQTTTTMGPPTFAAGLFSPSYTGRTNYRTVTLGTGLTTKAAWTHVDTSAELLYPFCSARVRAVEADVAAVTTLTFAIAYQGL